MNPKAILHTSKTYIGHTCVHSPVSGMGAGVKNYTRKRMVKISSLVGEPRIFISQGSDHANCYALNPVIDASTQHHWKGQSGDDSTCSFQKCFCCSFTQYWLNVYFSCLVKAKSIKQLCWKPFHFITYLAIVSKHDVFFWLCTGYTSNDHYDVIGCFEWNFRCSGTQWKVTWHRVDQSA